MWVEADIYSNVTVMQIINGKHYNRAIECHLFTLEALSDLWFEQFFAEHPDMIQALQECVNTLISSCQKQEDIAEAHTILLARMTELDLLKLMEEFDTSHAKYPMYRWARMYMRQVTALLQFIRSTRLRQWDLHLSSLEQLCIWFFAYNRMDYALNIPEYIARMYNLQHTNPEVWKEFEQGGFTVDTSPVAFTAIGVDQAQEHINKGHKGGGGICGITNNPEVLLRYCLSTIELTRLSSETENVLGLTQSVRKQHHDMSEAKVIRREKYINQLKEVLSKANPFRVSESTDDTDLKLVHLANKIIMPDNVQQNILDSEKRGEAEYRIFVEERICGDKNLWDSRSKVPVLGWTAGTRPVKAKTGSTEITLKTSSSMMARLLVITRSSRDIDLKHVIGKHEFSATNHMLMTPEGKLHPCCDKAQLIHKLTDQVEVDMVEEQTDDTVRH